MKITFVFAGFLFIGLASVSVWPLSCANAEESKAKKESRQSLDDAYRSWHKSLSSMKKEEREKALRAMLPTKADVAHLFPKQADKLWPMFEQENQRLLKNVDKAAKEIVDEEPQTKVTTIDIRKEEAKRAGKYQRLLAVIPSDVAVFRMVREGPRRISGSGTYLYLNKRWVLIRSLEAVPEVIEPMK